MIGKICGFICVISFVFGCASGNIGEMGVEIIDGAASAVELTLSLAGMMCLWSGIMRVASAAGLVRGFARLTSPVLRILFPNAYASGNGLGEISASIAANVFGLGNAATPLALKAMEKLQENNGDKTTASDDMIMFTVLGSASVDVFPTTLIALRRAANSLDPFEIVVPVWICSLLTASFGVLAVKACCAIGRKNK